MPNYLFIEYQSNGCDYTIGCGVRVNKLIEAPTYQEAVEIFKNNLLQGQELSDYSGNPLRFDNAATDVEVYRVTGKLDFDFNSLVSEWDDYFSSRAKKIAKEKDREEYERLKERFSIK